MQARQTIETAQTAIPPVATSEMLAASIRKPRHAELCSTARPTPSAHQLRVRVEGCGVCGSNLPVWEGKPWFTYPLEPGTPGHEGWGIVDAVGADVSAFCPGNRVAMLSSHAFAEYDISEQSHAVLLPKEVDGLPFPAEPLSCAMNVFKRSEIQSAQSVAIVGIGFLGALLTQLAKAAQAKVAAVSRREFARQVAETCGADATFGMESISQTAHELVRWNSDSLFDCVIEAAGTQATLDLAAQLTKEKGRLIVAGYHQDGPRQVDMQLWNWRGFDVINAHERDSALYIEGMRAAVTAVRDGTLNPTPLYTHAFRLQEIGNAFEMLRLRPEGFMKALVIP